MNLTRRNARIAGLFYLIVVLTGPFVLIYAPGQIIVTGDNAATAANMLAHLDLFRAWIGVGLLSELAFIATALALYRLLRDVQPQFAAVMALLVLIDAPLALHGLSNQIAVLKLLQNPALFASFDASQHALLATLLFTADDYGSIISEVFWGLWLLPLGALVYQSRVMPRVLGAWLVLNGLTYVALAGIRLFNPGFIDKASSLATPVLLGEVAFMLWLLIVGTTAPRPATHAATTRHAAQAR
ncbi:MAG TPA: DUF4386 domain-containing protein [Rhodanobacteraceae bacterium]|nr:DUF4386 domain-containing protein [Rhodanobacteraceae bacterium]